MATIWLALAILVATPAVAFADSWAGFVWTGNPSCGYVQRTLDNSGHPYMATTGTVVWVVNGAICQNYSYYQPPDHITVEQDLYAWINNTAVPCNNGPPIVNSGWSSYVATAYSWPTKPCNSGHWGAIWYYQKAGLWFQDANNNFHSGTTVSNWVDIS